MAAFVALTVRHKMKLAREWQRQLIATTILHPMPSLAIPPPYLPLVNQQWKKKTIQAGHQHQKAACNNIVMDQSYLGKEAKTHHLWLI